MASSWHDTHFSLEVPKGMSGVLQRCMWSFCNIMSTTLPRFNSDVNKPGVLRFLRPLPGLIDAVDLTPVRPKSSSHQQVHPKTKRVGFHSTPLPAHDVQKCIQKSFSKKRDDAAWSHLVKLKAQQPSHASQKIGRSKQGAFSRMQAGSVPASATD